MQQIKYFFIKVLKDNYIWIISYANLAVAIDCGDAVPLFKFLKENNLILKYVLITHHHYDHTNGLERIKQLTDAKIVGNYNTFEKLNKLDLLDINITGMQNIKLLNFSFNIIDTKGHTNDHVIYYEENKKWLFTGDTLFSLGCGRNFEGNVINLKSSLDEIKKLSDQTLIFCGHEYTLNNLRFVNHLKYFDTLKGFSEFSIDINEKFNIFNNTLPSKLSDEIKFNPFLNVNNLEFKKYMHKQDISDNEFFIYLRQLKDSFN